MCDKVLSDTALLILAGGYSSRMGRFKPLLPFGGKPVILRIMDIYRQAGVKEIAVVCGHEGERLAAALEGSGAIVLHNPRYQQGMFTSVLIGVSELRRLGVPAFFVTPSDFPLLSPSTPAAQIKAMADSGADIVYPLYKEVRGHPPLISSRLIPFIQGYDGEGGLKRALEVWGKGELEMHFDDVGIVSDMDSYDDYLRLLRLAGEDLPSPDDGQCMALMTKYGMPDRVIAHCKAVAACADELCEALKQKGHQLDAQLLHAAAMLHDIARMQPKHEQAAAEILRGEGYIKLAALVKVHNNIDSIELNEASLLYYADKRVLETSLVTLEQRFAASLGKCKTAQAKQAHHQRWQKAMAIEDLLRKEGVF